MDATENGDDQSNSTEEVKQSPATIETPHPAIDGGAGTKYCHKKQKNWPQRIEAICAILLVFITGFYAYYAKKQAKAATDTLGEIIKQYPEIKKSADAAHSASIVSKTALYSVQRAYLTFPPSPQVALIPFPGGRALMVEMPIDNAGATQAHKLKDRVACELTMGPLPNDFTFPDKKGECGTPWVATGANVVPAKDRIFSQEVFIEEKIWQEFIQQNLGPWRGRRGAPDHPTRGINFYGWVTYRDIFPDSPVHLTEFCRDLTILVVQPQSVTHSWGYCPTHNCTDEDCPDYKERIQIAETAPTYHPPQYRRKKGK